MSKGVVIITGAEGALGQVVAHKFVASGARVVGVHLPSHQGSLPKIEGLEWRPAELASPASVRTLVESTADVATLIHCAGGFRWSLLDQTSDGDFEFLVDANLKSSFYLLRELLPGMKKRNFGRIVLVSARATQAPTTGMGAYAATKAGINALVAAAADETRGFDININAVMPTIIDTPANRRDMPKADPGQWVTPEQLADLFVSLTGPLGKPLHGALIPVSGRL